MYIKKAYQQLWLIDDNGNEYNIAELLMQLVEKTKPKPKQKEIKESEQKK